MPMTACSCQEGPLQTSTVCDLKLAGMPILSTKAALGHCPLPQASLSFVGACP